MSGHVLNPVPKHKTSQQDEVEQQQWPVNQHVKTFEKRHEKTHDERVRELAPVVEFRELPLEPLVLVLFSCRQHVVGVVIVVEVFERADELHCFVEPEETQEIADHEVA